MIYEELIVLFPVWPIDFVSHESFDYIITV